MRTFLWYGRNIHQSIAPGLCCFWKSMDFSIDSRATERCDQVYFLLIQFRVSRHPQGESLLPCLLPEIANTDTLLKNFFAQNKKQSAWWLERRYQFPFLPLGFFARLTVRILYLMEHLEVSQGALVSRTTTPPLTLGQGTKLWRNALVISNKQSKQVRNRFYSITNWITESFLFSLSGAELLNAARCCRLQQRYRRTFYRRRGTASLCAGKVLH